MGSHKALPVLKVLSSLPEGTGNLKSNAECSEESSWSWLIQVVFSPQFSISVKKKTSKSFFLIEKGFFRMRSYSRFYVIQQKQIKSSFQEYLGDNIQTVNVIFRPLRYLISRCQGTTQGCYKRPWLLYRADRAPGCSNAITSERFPLTVISNSVFGH